MQPRNERDRILDVLDGLRGILPASPAVRGYLLELAPDEAGDPAAYITLLLDDAVPDEDWVSQKLEPIAQTVRNLMTSGGVDRWPYIRFARVADAGGNDAGRPAWRRVG